MHSEHIGTRHWQHQCVRSALLPRFALVAGVVVGVGGVGAVVVVVIVVVARPPAPAAAAAVSVPAGPCRGQGPKNVVDIIPRIHSGTGEGREGAAEGGGATTATAGALLSPPPTPAPPSLAEEEEGLLAASSPPPSVPPPHSTDPPLDGPAAKDRIAKAGTVLFAGLFFFRFLVEKER